MDFLNKQLFVLTALLLAVYSTAHASHIEINNGLCGGPLEADSGSLTFPSSPPTTDEVLCIWTIHLETRSTFRLNFSNFNVGGSDSSSPSCDDAAVRLNSLTNLIPSDRSEGYTFCNGNSPPNFFVLSENLITVIYRNKNSSNSNGFTLNWEGISIQPIQKIHESTFTTASSGVIRYPPIVGSNYPQNLVSTWLVQAKPVAGQTSQSIQLNLPKVDIASCNLGNPQDCLCDALILYQVNEEGVLNEERRFCGNVTAQDIQGLSSNFILALFTDNNEDESENGNGFEVVYSPSLRPPVSNTSTTCGGVVSGLSGLIEYKRDERLNLNERCIWTIRSLSRTQIRLTFNKLGFEDWADQMEVLGLSSTGEKTQFAISKRDQGVTITVNATVAIVSMFSWYLGAGTGFSLSFESGEEVDSQLLNYNDFSYLESNKSCGGVIKYGGNQIRRRELTTFVIQHPYSNEANYEPMTLNVTGLNLRLDPETGNCTDMIRVFRLHSAPGNPTYLQEVYDYGNPRFGVCQMDHVDNDPYYLVTDYVSVIFFLTDGINQNSGDDNGFEVTWNVDLGESFECE